MTAVQLADGVWRVPTVPHDLVNSFLLADDDGLVLVDAGLKRASRHVLAALEQLGRAPQDVTRVLLTHGHADHAGGLGGVVRATGARVEVHEREAPYVREGRGPRLDASHLSGRLLSRLPQPRWQPVEVDGTFKDDDVLPVGGGLRVLHTPGHSPGHCSFLHEQSGVLMTGDAVFNVRRLRWPPKGFCTDFAMTTRTAQRLTEVEVSVAAFAHGPHVAHDAEQALRAFVAGRAA